MREAREEMTKVQLELNLQIAELGLKAQPSTPQEVIEQCASAITAGLDEIGSAVRDCTSMLEESFEVLTNLGGPQHPALRERDVRTATRV